MYNKTRLPAFQANFHYVKINGKAQLIESPYYDHYELCNDLNFDPMKFSWRVTNKDIYKQILPKFEEISKHPHTGQRRIKYMSIRKEFKNLQKKGYFSTLESIAQGKKIKTK